MSKISKELVVECRERLLSVKEEIINRTRAYKAEYGSRDNKGDEVDQSVGALAEHQFLAEQERLRKQLIEIELALARIEQGSFGITWGFGRT